MIDGTMQAKKQLAFQRGSASLRRVRKWRLALRACPYGVKTEENRQWWLGRYHAWYAQLDIA